MTDTRRSGKGREEYNTLAVQIKRMLNDVIDTAFQEEVSEQMLRQFKRFRIVCTNDERKSFLGMCHFNEDRSSTIRMVNLGKNRYQDSLITAIHEVSHHVERSLHDTSGHGPEFYRIHKLLLFAAFDMEIITKEDVLQAESNARNADKLAKMMKDYKPNPVHYQQDMIQLFVYNAFHFKEDLKVRGYQWNKLDNSWGRKLKKEDLQDEQKALLALGISQKDIRYAQGGAVVTRLKKTACVYNVPFEKNQIVKDLGFRWNPKAKPRCWQKQIEGNTLPQKEYESIMKIPGVKIKIH